MNDDKQPPSGETGVDRQNEPTESSAGSGALGYSVFRDPRVRQQLEELNARIVWNTGTPVVPMLSGAGAGAGRSESHFSPAELMWLPKVSRPGTYKVDLIKSRVAPPNREEWFGTLEMDFTDFERRIAALVGELSPELMQEVRASTDGKLADGTPVVVLDSVPNWLPDDCPANYPLPENANDPAEVQSRHDAARSWIEDAPADQGANRQTTSTSTSSTPNDKE